MPRPKRVKTTTVKEELDDTPESHAEGNVTDFVIVLTKVYKINTGGVKSFCFQSEAKIDEPYLQSQYPTGGRFLLIELNASGEQVDSTTYDIEAKPMLQNSNGNGNHSEISMLRDELIYSRSIMTEMIRGLFNQRQNEKAQPTTVVELIQGLQGLHAISGSGKDPVELITKGMELGSRMVGGGDWKSDLASAAKDALPALAQAFSNRQQPQQPLHIAGTQPMIETTSDEMLKQGLAWLKSRVLAGQMSPDFAAEMLIQFGTTNPKYEPILKTAISGNIDNFIAIDTEIANEPYRTWFTAAITVVKEWYAEQTGNASNMDGRTGNPSDTTGDATTGN